MEGFAPRHSPSDVSFQPQAEDHQSVSDGHSSNDDSDGGAFPANRASLALLACGGDNDSSAGSNDSSDFDKDTAGAGWGGDARDSHRRPQSGHHYRGGRTQSQHQAAYQQYIDPTASDTGLGFGPFNPTVDFFDQHHAERQSIIAQRPHVFSPAAASGGIKTASGSGYDTPPMGWGHEKEDEDEEALRREELLLAVEGGGGMRADDGMLVDFEYRHVEDALDHDNAGGNSHLSLAARGLDSTLNMVDMASFVELDDEEREVQERIRRMQCLNQEMLEEEQHQLQDIYTKQVRKSFRNVRRLPEPSIQGRFMQTEEDHDGDEDQEDDEEEDEEQQPVRRKHHHRHQVHHRQHRTHKTKMLHREDSDSNLFFSAMSPSGDNLDVPSSCCVCGYCNPGVHSEWPQSLVGHSPACIERQKRQQRNGGVTSSVPQSEDCWSTRSSDATPPPAHFFIHEESSTGDASISSPLSLGTPTVLNASASGGSNRIRGKKGKRSFVNRIRLVAVSGTGTPPNYDDDEEEEEE